MSTKSKTTGNERYFGEDEIIVSKTDLNGKILYANDIFYKISGFSEEETLGKPHSFIRHPEMPRAVFKLLWDTISSGREVFAYVCNLSKNGDHYWVYAHVTPTFDSNGNIIGYHSNRRTPDRSKLPTIQKLYKILLDEERRHTDARKGVEASSALLQKVLEEQSVPYEQFIWQV